MATPPVRRAGRLTLADGASLLWSVAEGTRGRRWRMLRSAGDTSASLLLELTPAGRPARLEIAGSVGLLTLHPEPDEGSAHGNVVTAHGVRPIALAWSARHGFDIAGFPLVRALTEPPTDPRSDRGHVAVLVVDRYLEVAERPALGPDDTEDIIALDADGLPMGGIGWALE